MSAKKYNPESAKSASKCLPLKMDGPTPEIIQKAKEELGETPKTKQEALKELRLLISGESDLHSRTDDLFLLAFLRAKKYNAEQAFKRLKNFFTYRTRYAGIIADIYPSETMHVFNMNLIHVLRDRDPEGRMLAIVELKNVDIKKTNPFEVLSAILLGALFYLQSEVTQICGIVCIVNFKGISLEQFRVIASPTFLYRLMRGLQDCLPARVTAIHIINEPFYFNIIFNIAKQFLTEKLKKRLQFHGTNLQKFHKQIPPEILPLEFGGLIGPINSKEFADDMEGTDSYFVESFKYGYQGKKAEAIKRKGSFTSGLYV